MTDSNITFHGPMYKPNPELAKEAAKATHKALKKLIMTKTTCLKCNDQGVTKAGICGCIQGEKRLAKEQKEWSLLYHQMKFDFTASETKAFNNWIKTHLCKSRPVYMNLIDDIATINLTGLTVSITFTKSGLEKAIKCPCGERYVL